MCNCNKQNVAQVSHGVVNTIARGVVGLTKVGLRIGIADQSVIQARRDICRVCPEATINPIIGLSNISKCKQCGCFLSAKSQLKSEKCPLGKWPVLEEK